MEDLQSSEEAAFIPEIVVEHCYKVVDELLSDSVYEESKVPQWIESICEKCMDELAQMQRPFKYIVTCLIMQKNGAGLHVGESAHWDVANDNLAQFQWPSEKKREQQMSRMCVIVTVFGAAF
mmetsp:Transcript_8772/g.11582  ORF Transcript_8772/g.11582 Transcript_8772/m.11582 type:complete len:122 (-) Transcript_8772:71-436(-)|eukprot:CAMPEP_0117746724 /NCGR_PEP_ID=MMETSP0947-20121206/8109_1 /TAXON_ID=44440 /ORGANISM="Chattonella subsalsa, Strain CCMP2191" /LENGTH=121 /DNA_ID=CAMNT_0005564087 /DNA_START=154 /DNA_END=519 /DNA_ORIENTATION=+